MWPQSFSRVFARLLLLTLMSGLLPGVAHNASSPSAQVSPSHSTSAGPAAPVSLVQDQAVAVPATLPAQPQPGRTLGPFPLAFVGNAGQSDKAVRFLVRSRGGTLFFNASEAVLAIPVLDPAAPPTERGRQHGPPAWIGGTSVVRLRYDGTNVRSELRPGVPLPGVVNYLTGSDPRAWLTSLATYESLSYLQLYPGIDLRYDGIDGQLKRTYLVAAGADPANIRWRYAGATDVHLDTATGDLVITLPAPAAGLPGAMLTERAPIVWQDIGGRRVSISVRYDVAPNGAIGFVLGAYDRTQPLTIDPVLSYSTFLGGSGNDEGNAITVDSSGNAYVAGGTFSSNFPTAGPLQGTRAGSEDVFVSKVSADGTTLLYSTYLGGSGEDEANAIALDASGNIVLAGETQSTNYPTQNALDTSFGGGTCSGHPCEDAFVTKLNAAGSALLYSTYLGGSGTDEGQAVALDSAGLIYTTGSIASSSGLTLRNAYDSNFNGLTDAFVVVFNPALSGSASLLYSTYLGGSNDDEGDAIAVDSGGAAYLTGITLSSNFPTSAGARQGSYGGGSRDAFVVKIGPSAASGNQPPTVDAGPNQALSLPTSSATLSGSAQDDGLPNATLVYTWTVVSGPGTVTFGNAHAASTSAGFSAAGAYRLRLSVSDGAFTSSDDTLIAIMGANQAPVVNAGLDRTITTTLTILPLAGTVRDDGLPLNQMLSLAWSKVSGPGAATFGTPTQAQTTVRFSAIGTYVLRLTANDSALSGNDTLQVQVTAGSAPVTNQPPTVDAGPDRSVTLPTLSLTLAGSVSDDALPSGMLTSAWSLVSGPGTVTFGTPSQASTTATFSTAGQYVLRLSASDGTLSSSDDVRVILASSGSTQPGGVYVTGHDPDAHAFAGQNNAGAQHILQRAIAYVTFGASQLQLLVVTDRSPGVEPCDPLNDLASAGFSSVTLADAGSGSPGVANLASVNFNLYDAVVVASSPAGWLRQSELDILNSRAADLRAYINGGGGLVVQSEETQSSPYLGHDPYGFLPFVVSAQSLSQSETGNTLTAAGLALGLTSADINGNFSHNIFLTTGGMDIIDRDAQNGILSLAMRGKNLNVSGVGNLPPETGAGPDRLLTLPSTSLALSAATLDDGQPLTGTLTTTWSHISGPSTVTFDNIHQLATTAHFGGAGTYTIRLTVSDGLLSSSDDLRITVQAAAPSSPAIGLPLAIPGWIKSPLNRSTVSGQVPIVLTDTVTLTTGTLDYWPADNPAAATTLAASVSGSGGTTLATLDSTTLANGSYVIRLIGQASDGTTLASGVMITVVGENKPGRVRFEVTDLTVPLAGLPITVGRIYDSLEKGRRGDFGYGWSLSIGSPRLTIDPANNVTVTQPNGQRVTFYFTPASYGGVFGFLQEPTYTPEAGVYSSLTANGCPMLVAAGGQFWCFLDTVAYQPTTYTYTDPYGRVFVMGVGGQLQSITDLNQNTLTFGPTGISSSAGGAV